MRWFGVAVAVLALAAPAQADILVAIDKSQQRMTVTIDGVPSYRWTVSTGRPGYDTPSGSFRAIRLERVYFSKKFDDAPMPNSVFFYGGYAIHGTFEEARLGRAVSHGCVRLTRDNAATLFALVRQRGLSNTRVIVGDGLPGRRAAPMASISERGPPRSERRVESYDRGFQRFGAPAGGRFVERRATGREWREEPRRTRAINLPPRRYLTEAEMRAFLRQNGFR
jgi:hypothetical protein